MKCKCHPDSPFYWKHNPRPSVFIREVGFRVKGVILTDTGSYFAEDPLEERRTKRKKEQEITAYKEFGIYLRASPNVKPSTNKHER